ncbi:hypothetical protein TVAG_312390 [Trichomonas vaginalis G3]|uniref:Uncharacterized protein n=1 Tax=Trichomonas vaginalis (strain ATCC PRA-98 / G3) TaxID=412133 RepID=A2EHP4_TRIV3|nr:hypothetical protein TVAGG3_0242660 [Trichomonas vaginalis G3]EAY07840.1 hypothetical protein TVAG_312390 [Trichomonas vaginalis G3]KAI5553452.1 hypothetical protein TVAGG3_0242660 [Trichomonas vaginalis G3]|eukprot:XP_001320063.1 hypothetical protein [Trichomonas vaginalis G3]
MFSVLGFINDHFKVNYTYNFLFRFEKEYPSEFDFINQSTHPLYSNISANVSVEAVSPDCGTNLTLIGALNGIALSSSNKTLIDGSINHGYWYFAIGANTYYKVSGTITGPICKVDKGVTSVDLWLQYTDDIIFQMLPNLEIPSVPKCNSYHLLSNLHVFILMLLE